MRKLTCLFCILCLFISAAKIEDFPSAEISNGEIKVKFYLPDQERGYYRATRFDWSGVIPVLEYNGHNFFGVWNPAPYNPKLHDAIAGPVEDFSPLGYEEAKPGETFVKIGVGGLKKIQERAYRYPFTYDIVNPGKWTIKKKKDRIEIFHQLTDASGYSYLYTKTIQLQKNEPVMVIHHSLKNTGNKSMSTSVYNHNFFMIDQELTGPNLKLSLPFDIEAKDRGDGSLKGFGTIINVDGKSLVYNRPLNKGEQVYSIGLEGFKAVPEDYNITIENTKTGAGVKITSDYALEKLVYWACQTTACPEPYILLNVEPGKEINWKYSYEFFAP